jgi:hypothetical protein
MYASKEVTEGGREAGREGGREGRRQGGREGRRQGGRGALLMSTYIR